MGNEYQNKNKYKHILRMPECPKFKCVYVKELLKKCLGIESLPQTQISHPYSFI